MMRSMIAIGGLTNSVATDAGPTAEVEITQPAVSLAPLPESFKCEKCGAAFADEGAAAAHMQTCKGPELMPENKPAS